MNPLDLIAAAYWLAMSSEPSWFPGTHRGTCSRCGGPDPGFWLSIIIIDNLLADARFHYSAAAADEHIATLRAAHAAGWPDLTRIEP